MIYPDQASDAIRLAGVKTVIARQSEGRRATAGRRQFDADMFELGQAVLFDVLAPCLADGSNGAMDAAVAAAGASRV